MAKQPQLGDVLAKAKADGRDDQFLEVLEGKFYDKYGIPGGHEEPAAKEEKKETPTLESVLEKARADGKDDTFLGRLEKEYYRKYPDAEKQTSQEEFGNINFGDVPIVEDSGSGGFEVTPFEILIENFNANKPEVDPDRIIDVENLGVEELAVIEQAQDVLRKTAEKDPVIQDGNKKADELIHKEVVEMQDAIRSKYNFTDPEQFAKAQEEFSSWYSARKQEILSEDLAYTQHSEVYGDQLQDMIVRGSAPIFEAADEQRINKEWEDHTKDMNFAQDWMYNGPAKPFFRGLAVGIEADLPRMWTGFKQHNLDARFRELDSLTGAIDPTKTYRVAVTDDGEILGPEGNEGLYRSGTGGSYTIQEVDAQAYGEWAKEKKKYYELQAIGTIADQKKYADYMAKYSNQAHFLDADGDIDWSKITSGKKLASLVGQQSPQFLVGVIPGYGILQETGNIYTQVLEEVAAQQLGKSPQDLTAEELLAVMQSDDIDIDSILNKGILSGSLDFASAANVLGATKNLLQASFKNGFKIMGNYLFAGATETVTEGAQGYIEQTAIRDHTGKEIDWNAVKEEGIAGGLVSLLIPLPGGAVNFTSQAAQALKQDYLNTMAKSADVNAILSHKDDVLIPFINDQVESGNITPEEGADIIEDIEATAKAGAAIPPNLSPKDKKRAIPVIKEREALKEKIKGVDKAFTEGERARIKVLEEKLAIIAGSATKVTPKTQKTTQTSKKKTETKSVPKGQKKPTKKKPTPKKEKEQTISSRVYDLEQELQTEEEGTAAYEKKLLEYSDSSQELFSKSDVKAKTISIGPKTKAAAKVAPFISENKTDLDAGQVGQVVVQGGEKKMQEAIAAVKAEGYVATVHPAQPNTLLIHNEGRDINDLLDEKTTAKYIGKNLKYEGWEGAKAEINNDTYYELEALGSYGAFSDEAISQMEDILPGDNVKVSTELNLLKDLITTNLNPYGNGVDIKLYTDEKEFNKQINEESKVTLDESNRSEITPEGSENKYWTKERESLAKKFQNSLPDTYGDPFPLFVKAIEGTGWAARSDDGLLYEIESKAGRSTAEALLADKEKIVKIAGIEVFKRMAISVYTEGLDVKDTSLIMNELRSLKDVKQFKTEIDLLFDKHLKTTENPDGTHTIARTVSLAEKPSGQDVGFSWSTDPDLTKHWVGINVGPDGGKYFLYADVNLKDNNFITVGEYLTGSQQEIIPTEELFEGKNFRWEKIKKGVVVESGVFENTIPESKIGGFQRKSNLIGSKSQIAISLNNSGNKTIDTLIHEADHSLNNILQKDFPSIWTGIVDFVTDHELFEAWVKLNVETKNGNYTNLAGDIDGQVDEFIAQLTGPHGQNIIASLYEEDPSFFQKLMKLLGKAVDAIMSKLKIAQRKEDIKDIEDLIDMGTAVILAGKKIEVAYVAFTDPKPSSSVKAKPTLAQLNKKVDDQLETTKAVAADPTKNERDLVKQLTNLQVDQFMSEVEGHMDALPTKETYEEAPVSQLKSTSKDDFIASQEEMDAASANVLGKVGEAHKMKDAAQGAVKLAEQFPDDQTTARLAWAMQGVKEYDLPTSLAFTVGKMAYPDADLGPMLKESTNKQLQTMPIKAAQGTMGLHLLQTLIDAGIIEFRKRNPKSEWKIIIVDENALGAFLQSQDPKDAQKHIPKGTLPYFDGEMPLWETSTEDGVNIVGGSFDSELLKKMTPENYPKVFEEARNAAKPLMAINPHIRSVYQQLMKKPAFTYNDKNLKASIKRSKRRKIISIMQMAEFIGDRDYRQRPVFEKRSRLRSAMRMMSHQDEKMGLSLIRAAESESVAVNKGGIKKLLIQASDTEGFQGRDFDERVQHAREMFPTWMKWAANPTKYYKEIFEGAKEPWIFYATINDLFDATAWAKETGRPITEYVSGVPIHADQTASGLGVITTITKDQDHAGTLNIDEDQERGDPYTELGEYFFDELSKGEHTQADIDLSMEYAEKVGEYERQLNAGRMKSEDWKVMQKEYAAYKKKYAKQSDKLFAAFMSRSELKNKFVRKMGKIVVMTKYYGGKIFGMKDQVLAELTPEKAYFPGLPDAWAYKIADMLNKESNARFVRAKNYMDAMSEMGRETAEQGMQFEGPVNGFPMKNRPDKTIDKQIKEKNYRGKSTYIDTGKPMPSKMNLTYKEYTDIADKAKAAVQAASFMTHMSDAQIVAYLFLNWTKWLVTIHDNFLVLAGDSDAMYDVLRTGYVDVFKGPYLENVIREIYENNGNPEGAQGIIDMINIGTLELTKDTKLSDHIFDSGNALERANPIPESIRQVYENKQGAVALKEAFGLFVAEQQKEAEEISNNC